MSASTKTREFARNAKVVVPAVAAAGATIAFIGSSLAGAATVAPQAIKNGTFQGAVANTQWGPVQVELVVQGGKVTTCNNLQHPNGNGTSNQINAQAVPTLNGQVVSVSSAQIQGVNGATVTSNGYRQSVQSALDMAAA